MAGDYMQGNKDDATVVPFSDNETEKEATEILGDAEKQAASPEEKTRWQKRRERVNGIVQEAKQTKAELEKERQEKAELKERLARLEGYAAAQAAQQQQRPSNDVDPYQKKLDTIDQKRREHWTAYQAEVQAGKMDGDRTKYYERISREIDEEKTEVFAERAVARRIPQQQQDQQRQFWVNQYPEVYRNDKAFQYAQARWKMREAQGENIGEDQVHEILQEARVQFKLGPKKAPSASERDRFSGVPSSGSGGSGASGDGIAMTKDFKRMATALYPDLPEQDAFKKWANGPGKKLKAAKAV